MFWVSPSGMIHKSEGSYDVTKCGRKMKLSLKPLLWRRALKYQEEDFMFPRCKQCGNG